MWPFSNFISTNFTVSVAKTTEYTVHQTQLYFQDSQGLFGLFYLSLIAHKKLTKQLWNSHPNKIPTLSMFVLLQPGWPQTQQKSNIPTFITECMSLLQLSGNILFIKTRWIENQTERLILTCKWFRTVTFSTHWHTAKKENQPRQEHTIPGFSTQLWEF